MAKYQCHGITRGGSRCGRTVDSSGFCKDHPFDDGLVTKSGFAKLQGVTPSAVSRWLESETIAQTEDGCIKWKEAERSIASSRDITRPLQRHGEKHDAAIDADVELEAEEVRRRYSLAQMRREEERAKREEIARLEEEGLLVPLEDVEADAEDAAIRLKAAMMAIPDRAAPELTSMTDLKEVHAYLVKEIREALAEMSSDFLAEDGDAA